MSDRWWAPTRATVDPDAVVLALLRPSGDSAGDLGATLLAVHRAGAAAAETVSKSAVPSESKLVRTLAASRAELAGLVVDAATASMETRYAGLFVRDFMDDAEESALTLYRTAISKGVSGPSAVERVAAVYGVPFRELGKYVQLASDPKANQVALTDAADRCLLTYVSKMVDMETKETVSKAAATTTEVDQWDAKEHPRDNLGRFADVMTGRDAGEPSYAEHLTEATADEMSMFRAMMTGAAPNVGSTPDARKKAKRAKTAAILQQLNTKPEPSAVKPSAVKPSAVKASTRYPVKLAPSGVVASSLKKKPPKPKGAVDDSTMALYSNESRDGYQELDKHMDFFVPVDDSMELLARMPGTVNQRLTRMGYLLDASSSGHVAHDSEEAIEVFEKLATRAKEITYSSTKATGPTHEEVDDEDIEDAFDMGIQPAEYLKNRENEMAKLGGPKANLTERQYTKAFRDYNTKQWLIVHVGDRNLGEQKRPFPVVSVYEASTVAAQKVIEEDRVGFEELKLDNNQLYEHDDDNDEIFYDPTRKVFVHRIKIYPISDEEGEQVRRQSGIGKSLDLKERTEFNQLHPRDSDGQFRSGSFRNSLVAATVTPVSAIGRRWSQLELSDADMKPKLKRSDRQTKRLIAAHRKFDTQVALPSQVEPSSVKPSSVKSSAVAATNVQGALIREALKRKPASTAREIKVLDDSHVYHVLTHEQFGDLLKKGSAGKLPKGEGYTMNSYGKMQILESKDLGGEETIAHLLRIIEDQVTDPETGMGMQDAFTHEVRQDSMAHTYEDVEALRVKVDEELDAKGYSFATAEPVMAEGDWVFNDDLSNDGKPIKWQISVSKQKVSPLVLIEHDVYNDWPNPDADLTFLGNFSTRDLVAKKPSIPESNLSLDEIATTGVGNARVQVYKAEFSRYVFNPLEDPEH